MPTKEKNESHEHEAEQDTAPPEPIPPKNEDIKEYGVDREAVKRILEEKDNK